MAGRHGACVDAGVCRRVCALEEQLEAAEVERREAALYGDLLKSLLGECLLLGGWLQTPRPGGC